MNYDELESFIATVRDSGSNTVEITIPYKIAEFCGLVPGDRVKVLLKKLVSLEKNEE